MIMTNLRDLPAREHQAWRELSLEEYERAVCAMMSEGSFDLVRATLRRQNPLLTESRACAAEWLLSVLSSGNNASAAILFLACWLQLSQTILRGPESVTESAPLPAGAALPEGADPALITNPELRHQAELLVQRHAEQVQLWNAKQRAVGHLVRIIALLRAARPRLGETFDDLTLAMSLAPGLPSQVESQLQQ